MCLCVVIVVVGFIVNLLLVVLLYLVVNWNGVEEFWVILVSLVVGLVVESVGLWGGELVECVVLGVEDLELVCLFEDLWWLLICGVFEGFNVCFDV